LQLQVLFRLPQSLTAEATVSRSLNPWHQTKEMPGEEKEETSGNAQFCLLEVRES
jgi:hypothetical protein